MARGSPAITTDFNTDLVKIKKRIFHLELARRLKRVAPGLRHGRNDELIRERKNKGGCEWLQGDAAGRLRAGIPTSQVRALGVCFTPHRIKFHSLAHSPLTAWGAAGAVYGGRGKNADEKVIKIFAGGMPPSSTVYTD